MRACAVKATTLAAVLTLTACGEKPQSPPQPSAPTVSSSVVVPSTSAAKTEYGVATRYTFQARDGRGDGFTEDVELSLGAPIPASQAPQPYPADCQLDPQRDLYIPLSLKITNTTPNFPYKVSYRFKPVQLDDDNVRGYLNGTCVERFGLVTHEGPTLGLSSASKLEAGQHVAASGFIAYRGFFSPNGKADTQLAKVFLDLGIRHDGKHGVIVDVKAEPGLVGYTGLDGIGVSNHYVVPVNGVTSPCTQGLFKRKAFC